MAVDILQDINIGESVRHMNEIMRRKLASLRDIYNLSQQAYSYINEDDVERLYNVIDEKQKFINDVDHLDKQFLIEFNKIKSDLGIESFAELHLSQSPGLEELHKNTADILEMLQKIYDYDLKINSGAAKLREGITVELIRIKKQKHISEIYSNDGNRRHNNEPVDYIAASSTIDIKK